MGSVRLHWPKIALVAWLLCAQSSIPALASPSTIQNGFSSRLQSSDLSLSCPEAVLGGDRVTFTLSGQGLAIIDAGEGTFPNEPPNSEFAPQGDGGNTMVGNAPRAETVDLIWLAPEVEESHVVYLFASNDLGQTPGECAIQVLSASDGEQNGASSADPEVGESQEIRNAQATETAKPTNTPKPTKTPVPYNEVRGLPTSEMGPELTIRAATGTATRTPTPTPTVRQNATFGPTTLENGLVAKLIGPEGGLLVCPSGAQVEIPAGALRESSTVTIDPVPDSKISARGGVEIIPNSGFDVTIAGPDGRAIDYELGERATLTITLPEEAAVSGMRLYRFEGSALVALPNTRIEGNVLSATVSEFSRFVVGVPAPAATGTNANLKKFVLAAFVLLLGMIAVVILGGMFRPRRQRVITNRRTNRTRYR
jgi:hypothetical protein